ncbi:hypothetical protein BGW36DRAFT_430185 [Talaromyces proteolyticus]|uniref:Actin-like ATPase domain-containing protein n=1 Tax=Talaromyces proteolyticus TaxID=1131652 RepID=A0AAD4PW41_9EURO|nr:uncharacterized protein BGW36DRAFT_430185 [Talaromyces proteolyticus]KAH8694162.1 hypothetical protein BGW36DRAFT_430185 [Talaromyces proteolyticus]
MSSRPVTTFEVGIQDSQDFPEDNGSEGKKNQKGSAHDKARRKNKGGAEVINGKGAKNGNSTDKRKQGQKKKATETSNFKEKSISIVVGVDFGTTYSGFASSVKTSSYDRVTKHRKWPSCSNAQEKVPTVVSYNTTDEGQKRLSSWGYAVKSSSEAYTWFKLGLSQTQRKHRLDDQLLSEEISEIKCPDGRSYKSVAIDYLQKLYAYILSAIEDELGEATFSQVAFHFVLATPAGWPDFDRQNIKNCAKAAGFGARESDKISMVSEPEAAAICVFHTYSTKLGSECPLKPESNVMIVDMGGGTVDLITYTVKNLKPFEVEEACVGSGAKCGSTSINRQFLKFMESRFGDQFKNKPQKDIGLKSKLMNGFEDIKRMFTEDADSQRVPFPLEWDNADQYDTDNQEIILTNEELRSMFDPMVKNIFELIQGQVEEAKKETNTPITTIILCGGLAESKYIRFKIKAFCNEYLKTAQVMIPESPWSAICVGATMSGLDPNKVIKSRRARRAYGTVVHRKFEEGLYEERDVFDCPKLGKRVGNVMHWHIKKGDRKLPNDRYKWLTRGFIDVGNDDNGEIEVFSSDLNDAPSRRYHPGVDKIGSLPIDLSEIIGNNSRKRKSEDIVSGFSRKRRIPIQIGQVILPQADSVEFVARTGNKKLGKATFNYAPIMIDGKAVADVDDDDAQPDVWLIPTRANPTSNDENRERSTEDERSGSEYSINDDSIFVPKALELSNIQSSPINLDTEDESESNENGEREIDDQEFREYEGLGEDEELEECEDPGE